MADNTGKFDFNTMLKRAGIGEKVGRAIRKKYPGAEELVDALKENGWPQVISEIPGFDGTKATKLDTMLREASLNMEGIAKPPAPRIRVGAQCKECTPSIWCVLRYVCALTKRAMKKALKFLSKL